MENVQQDVRVIKRTIARLNEIEKSKGLLSRLSLKSYKIIHEQETLAAEEKRLLVALENAWYGTAESGKYSHDIR